MNDRMETPDDEIDSSDNEQEIKAYRQEINSSYVRLSKNLKESRSN